MLVAIAVVGLVAHAGVAPAREDAARGHAMKRCGIVAKGARDYRVKSRGVACRHARRWVRSYLRKRGRPRGYSCHRTRGKVTFYCFRGSRSYWAERL